MANPMYLSKCQPKANRYTFLFYKVKQLLETLKLFATEHKKSPCEVLLRNLVPASYRTFGYLKIVVQRSI